MRHFCTINEVAKRMSNLRSKLLSRVTYIYPGYCQPGHMQANIVIFHFALFPGQLTIQKGRDVEK